MAVDRVTVSVEAARNSDQTREQMRPERGLEPRASGHGCHLATLEDHRHDLLEVAALETVLRGLEQSRESVLIDRLPIDLGRRREFEPRREFFDRYLLPRIGMAPRARFIQKEVGDEERRAVRTAERELLERAPSDEQTAGRGLDESEVGHRSGFYAVR